MKHLVCEMCGGTDLVKQDGIFVCQSCNTKYSTEEAKKMMVEGTVKIDNSERLNNLYKLARQAKDSNDAENAAKYYDLIKQEDPNSWEACFYNMYFRVSQTRIMYIESAANTVRNSTITVFDLIKNNEDGIETKQLQAKEVALRVILISSLLESSAKKTFVEAFNDSFGQYKNSGDACLKYALEYGKRAVAISIALDTCGDLLERDFSGDEMMKLACQCWKKALEIYKNIYALYDNHAERYKQINKVYAKIKKYEPGYVLTAPTYPGFPRAFVNIVEKNSRSDFNVTRSTVSTSGYSSSTSQTSSNNSSGGCYVATAVYGSYDCPQVWTLRRYRDYTLAKTWYGKAFIRTYYAISPTVVRLFGNTEWFQKMWRGKLDRMVDNLNAEGIENTPYEDKKW